MMIDNGSQEPSFDIAKLSAFEVTTWSAIEGVDVQEVGKNDAPAIYERDKSFPKSFPKLIPHYFSEEDAAELEKMMRFLTIPRRATDLATLMSITPRTMKDKYLRKMIAAGVVALTTPDKATSSQQRYKLTEIPST